MELSALEFIHRYLQHVLPKGFVKVRYYGLYAHAYKKKLNDSPVGRLSKTTIKQSSELNKNKHHFCSKCNNQLILIEEFGKEYFYSNGPLKRQVLLLVIYKKLQTSDH